jgi:3-deoxy-D-manno-octulosonic-acid transferase
MVLETERPGKAPYALYRALAAGLFAAALPARGLADALKPELALSSRLGRYPASTFAGLCSAPRFWVHASSVGEVAAAIPLLVCLKEIFPKSSAVLSSFTQTGLDSASILAKELAICVRAPLDMPRAVGRALDAAKPDVLIFVETELWPNWIVEAKKRGIKVALVNGRISGRSIKKYLKARPFFRHALSCLDLAAMISHADAIRISKMGARQSTIRIMGSAKFDALAARVNNPPQFLHENILGEAGPIVVAGSTRRGEHGKVLDAFVAVKARWPKAVLVLAPRHPGRYPEAARLIREKGLSFQNLSSLEQSGQTLLAPVLLVDAMGRLFDLYRSADAVFCGASLVPLGGQNVLEPAALAKPVLYGPHTQDFAQAVELLESVGAGIRVENSKDLAQKLIGLLEHPQDAQKMGAAGRKAVLSQTGPAHGHAMAVADMLKR